MGAVKLYSAIISTAIFSIALITFAITFATDNSANFSLDEDFSDTNDNIQGNLTVWDSDISNNSKSFTESEIQSGETFRTGGQFKGGMVSSMKAVFAVLILGFTKLFGVGSGFGIIFSMIVAFITFLMIAYTYKLWMGRNPD